MKFRLAAVSVWALAACQKAAPAQPGGPPTGTGLAPTVTISSPANGAIVTAPALQVVGSATDTDVVNSLSYQLNGHTAVPVSISASTAVAFGFTVTGLSAGANTLVVFASTASATGQSAPLSITFTASSQSFTPPAAADVSISAVTENEAPVALVGSGGNGNALSYTIVDQPQDGVLTGTAPGLTYRSNPGFTGTDTFTYTVSDGTTTTGPATVTVTVVDGSVLYVDSAHGADTNSGHAPDRAKQTIQAAIDTAAAPYLTVSVAAGLYPELLTINKSITVQGPAVTGALAQTTNEPQAVVQPLAGETPAVAASYLAIVDIGDASGDATFAAASSPVVTLDNLKIDGSLLGPSLPGLTVKFYGVALHAGATAKFDNDFFWYERLSDSLFAGQVGQAIHGIGANIDVESSLFSQIDKQILTLVGNTDVTATPNTLKVNQSHLIGTDPTTDLTPAVSNSQNGLVVYDNIVATLTNNVFENFGASGPANAALGGAKVETHGSIGFAVLIETTVAPSMTNVDVLTGNTFTNTQGIYVDYPGYAGAPGIAAPALVADNTVNGGYFTIGAFAGYDLYGIPANDPNFLNYGIALAANWSGTNTQCASGTPAGCTLFVAPGTYCLQNDLLDLTAVTPTVPPSLTIAAAATPAPTTNVVDIYVPDTAASFAGSLYTQAATADANAFTAGPGVTIHTGHTFGAACP